MKSKNCLTKPCRFEGLYFKQQGQHGAVAFIPALHTDKKGKQSATLQILTDTGSYLTTFPPEAYIAYNGNRTIRLENCIFSPRGCKLDLNADGITAKGVLRYGKSTLPDYHIMGIFCLMPALQCRHGIFSLYHRVNGNVTINGKEYVFHNGTGYIEGDRGRSFPRRYIWTQCNQNEDCVTLAVADVPVGPTTFTGCIAIVLTGGRQYRLATYCGAKVLHVSSHSVLIRQGPLLLEARLLQQTPQPLYAPQSGCMNRIIHESLSSMVRYSLLKDGKPLLCFTSKTASFENAWNTV